MPDIQKAVTRNNLFFVSLFLLAFIPLYPKIPLFSPIEQYIVRVRLEDLFLVVANVMFIGYLLMNKVTLHKQFTKLVFLYVLVSTTSLLSAVYILGTIPQQQLHLTKSLLHFFRYLEYFSLFFIV